MVKLFRVLLTLALSLAPLLCSASASSGTGFFITSTGYIATNFHVVEGATSLSVQDFRGQTYTAKVVRSDVANDLAIIKVEGKFSALPLARSSTVRRGDSVFTLGFPNTRLQGLAVKFTEGTVSSLSGVMDEPNNFQVSVPIQPGNSGGPLINREGAVVGVVVAKLSATAALKSGSQIPEAVNYAVKSNYLLELVATDLNVSEQVRISTGKGKESALNLLVAKAEPAVVFIVSMKIEEVQRSQAEQAAKEMRPGQVFKDCTDCGDMVVIPAGTFQMGGNEANNEAPIHNVIISQFAIGRTAVTQYQWEAVMGSNPSKFRNCGSDCPVESVSWDDAQAFVQKLNAKTGKTYRLPSEAEWEYACRAGANQTYCGSDSVDSVAVYGSRSGNNTMPVASKQPNAWGLYDMSGNVWEWTQDCWHQDYGGAPSDGSAWTTETCSFRVRRGGSFSSPTSFVRAASRYGGGSKDHSYFDGFRLARALQ